jgi:glycerol kinase
VAASLRVFAGVDQGTTGTRTSLFDARGKRVATSYRRSRTWHPRPGWDEQDGDELVEAIEVTLTEALASLGDARLTGIGIANQGESVIAFDRRNGRALSPVILWSDRRGSSLVRSIEGTDAHAVLERTTGLPLDPYFSASKLAWMLRELESVREAAEAGRLAIGTLDTFFLFRLSRGRAFATDPSTASRTGLMDLARRRFDPACLEAWEIDATLLPRVVPTALQDPIASTLGAPITASICDQQAALAAIGAVRPGEVKVTHGTGCFIDVNVGAVAPRPDGGLMPTVAWELPSGEAAYAVEGGVFTAAVAVDWLVSLGLASDAAQVDALAREASGSEAIFLPSFNGVGAPWWRDGAAGVFAALRASTSRADLARAVLEGVAHRVADVLDAMADELATGKAVRADGGLSQSAILLQLEADLSGRTIHAAAEREGTAAGAAAFAAMAAGELDLAELAARVEFEPAVEPRVTDDERAARRSRWRAFVEATRQLDPDQLVGARAGK